MTTDYTDIPDPAGATHLRSREPHPSGLWFRYFRGSSWTLTGSDSDVTVSVGGVQSGDG